AVSVAPPAGNGTTSLIGRSGNAQAAPPPSEPNSKLDAAIARARRRPDRIEAIGTSRLPPSLPSSPGIDRDRLAVLGAHDAPVTVGFAADHHHVDVLLGEDADQLVFPGFEPGRHRLLAEGRPGINVVLHELQIPVAAGRHLAGLVDEAD